MSAFAYKKHFMTFKPMYNYSAWVGVLMFCDLLERCNMVLL